MNTILLLLSLLTLIGLTRCSILTLAYICVKIEKKLEVWTVFPFLMGTLILGGGVLWMGLYCIDCFC